jgi:hypothetical protein
MNNNDRGASYRRMYCGIIDAIKRELTNRLSDTKFLSLLQFGDFKHYSEELPATASHLK